MRRRQKLMKLKSLGTFFKKKNQERGTRAVLLSLSSPTCRFVQTRLG